MIPDVTWQGSPQLCYKVKDRNQIHIVIVNIYTKLNVFSVLDSAPNLVDGACLAETGYEIPTRDPITINYGPFYDIRMRTYAPKCALSCSMNYFLYFTIMGDRAVNS